jgi:16S rRNA (uracil1498-N3)-methyltransferase
MADRFFFTGNIVDGRATIDGDQAHHLLKVMRTKPGDQVTLFDGQGTEYLTEVESVTKKSLSLTVLSTREKSKPNPEVTIAVALPKGDRQKFLIEKLVELGASKLIPLTTERSVAIANEKSIERLKKQVIEASKQCGRAYLMEIGTTKKLQQLIEESSLMEDSLHSPSIHLVADPYTESRLSEVDLGQQPAVIAVGPEGGFSDKELELLEEAGWKKVCISKNVLRIETAAIAAATLLLS